MLNDEAWTDLKKCATSLGAAVGLLNLPRALERDEELQRAVSRAADSLASCFERAGAPELVDLLRLRQPGPRE